MSKLTNYLESVKFKLLMKYVSFQNAKDAFFAKLQGENAMKHEGHGIGDRLPTA